MRVAEVPRRRHPGDDRFEDFLDPEPRFRARQKGLLRRDGEDFLHLVLAFRDVRARQVDLVDHRDDGQFLPRRQMHVGDRLRFHALRRVDQQQRALACRQAARHLVGEIHVARRVQQVQLVGLAVLRLVIHRHRVRLDRDAALALQVHGIEQLVLLVAPGDRAGGFEQPVRQRGLPVVDVGDDGKIPGEGGGHAGWKTRGKSGLPPRGRGGSRPP